MSNQSVAKRSLSPQAQVAKLCRQYLKGRGIKCRATSESFSMGDAVDVHVFDQNHNVMQEIKAEFSQYEYGHFDGMEDMYVYSNSRKDIPQTKYLHIHNEYSDKLNQAAWDWLRTQYANGDGKPADYQEAKNLQWFDNGPTWERVSDAVYRLLNGYNKKQSDQFWQEYEAKP